MFEGPNSLQYIYIENVAYQIQRCDYSKQYLPEKEFVFSINRVFKVSKQNSRQWLKDCICGENHEDENSLVIYEHIEVQTGNTFDHTLCFVYWYYLKCHHTKRK